MAEQRQPSQSGGGPSKAAAIERAIEKPIAGAIKINTTGGLIIRDANEAMEFAKMMAISGSAIRSQFRNNPGTCLAVAIQAYEWGMNPFAVANRSYVVNDQLAYESSLYNAVATRRAPIEGRLRISYDGEGLTRRCMVSATLRDSEGGGEIEYESPQFSQINPKNSPLWKNDPDQQLAYFSVRAFVRRHFPDVMMGVYTVDELYDADEPVFRQGAKRKIGTPPAEPEGPGVFDGAFTEPHPDGAEDAQPEDEQESEAPPAEQPRQGQKRRFGP